jgi:outer membrane protein TolC
MTIRQTLSILIAFAGCVGCAAKKAVERHVAVQPPAVNQANDDPVLPQAADRVAVRLASHQQPGPIAEELRMPSKIENKGSALEVVPASSESLEQLEAMALTGNPSIRRARQEAAAAWAKTGYVNKLPDPVLSTMFYVPPMMLEPDRMVGEVQVMQMIPWLDRLRAEGRRAHLEALAAENEYRAVRLRVLGDLRGAWYKIYVVNKQIETTFADKSQLESLLRTANARVRTGDAQTGDVLMATLELSNLQEQLIRYRSELTSTIAELNMLVGRDAGTPVAPAEIIVVGLPEWTPPMLVSVADDAQPELIAARLRTSATRWGIEIARLKRRPDLTFSGGWVLMDAPGANVPGAGADVATVGVSTNLPFCRSKYNSMYTEATREHHAAHASEDEIRLQLDAAIADLWAQARAAQETLDLYDKSILPQARQTFAADQQALANNAVTFDRVVRDYRTLLNLELGRHRALGDLATALARVRQTVGVDLTLATGQPALSN